MGLFGKKKEIRFEAITIDRQRDVFRALEQRGWKLCSEPFQIDLDKAPDKLRKDAMSMARDLNADLLIETWDPIFKNKPFRGLSYSAWRPMTPEEIKKKQMEAESAKRPNYSDSMGVVQAKRQEIVLAEQVDLEALQKVMEKEVPLQPEIVTGKLMRAEEVGLISDSGSIRPISAEDPYHRTNRSADEVIRESPSDQGGEGPVFEQSMKIELGEPDTTDPTASVDGMAMMLEAAPLEPAKKKDPQQSP
jgi:hypothetical protein